MSMQDNNDQDPLEGLLKFAGRREAVDPDRSQRVERQLHDHWKQSLVVRRSAERRRRTIRIGGMLAIAASLVLTITLFVRYQAPPAIVATVASLAGDTQLGSLDRPMAATSEGAEIRAGSILETSENSGALLILSSGHDVRVAAMSRLRFQPNSIMLDKGSVYVDSGPDGPRQKLLLKTSFATVSELGTQYLASITNDSIVVSVREGAINLERDSGPLLKAIAGEALLMKSDGSAERESILGYGERWKWASALGRPIELEGLMLAEFLAWFSREYGLEVAYDSVSLEQDAGHMELGGSVRGLDEVQALTSVITAVGLQYELQGGLVTISRLTTD